MIGVCFLSIFILIFSIVELASVSLSETFTLLFIIHLLKEVALFNELHPSDFV
jgi:hypothetical protein